MAYVYGNCVIDKKELVSISDDGGKRVYTGTRVRTNSYGETGADSRDDVIIIGSRGNAILSYSQSRYNESRGHDGSDSRFPGYKGILPVGNYGHWWIHWGEFEITGYSCLCQFGDKCKACFRGIAGTCNLIDDKDKLLSSSGIPTCLKEYE
jgi:hypothetical protein